MKTFLSSRLVPRMSTHAAPALPLAACCLALIAPRAFAAPSGDTAAPSSSSDRATTSRGAKPIVQQPSSKKLLSVNHAMSSKAATKSAAPLVATERRVLSNGLTLVLRRDQTAPRMAISLLVRASAADETIETAGWRRLLAEAMLQASYKSDGAQKEDNAPATLERRADAQARIFTGQQLQRAADDVGGRIGATVGDDSIEFWVIGDSDQTPILLDLLRTLVQRPRLAQSDVDEARRRMMERAQNDGDDIATLATGALRAQLYRDAGGRSLAYALPSNGTSQSLEGLSQRALVGFYNRFFQPSRMTVAMAGDLKAGAARAVLEQISAPRTDVPIAPALAPGFAPTGKNDPVLIVRQLPTRAAWVFVSYRVAASNGADAPAVRVLSALLGEAPDSRLPRRLMGGVGFSDGRAGGAATASQAAVSFSPRRFGGELVLFAQTSPTGVEAVKNAMLDEARKLRDAPPTQSELAHAKNFARGTWAVEREGLRERAFQAALAASLSPAPAFPAGTSAMPIPADSDWPARLNAVSPADIRRVAQKYLDSYAVALIMPEE